jgi:hypothetical protein
MAASFSRISTDNTEKPYPFHSDPKPKKAKYPEEVGSDVVVSLRRVVS